MRCRRLRTSSTIPQRPRGDLWATNRQDSIDTAAVVGPSISRIKKNFFLAPNKCLRDLFGPLANRINGRSLQDANVYMFTLAQQQLGSGAERRAYIRVDAPQQVLALGRVLVRAKMPDAVRGARVDD